MLNEITQPVNSVFDKCECSSTYISSSQIDY